MSIDSEIKSLKNHLMYFALFLGFLVIFVAVLLVVYDRVQLNNEAKKTIEIIPANKFETESISILGNIDNKEIAPNNYQMVLKKQKDLNSTYFNQQVAKAMHDHKITNKEYIQINSIYKQIIETRKAISADPLNTEVFTDEDRLNSIKKEIKLHSLSQNDNLI